MEELADSRDESVLIDMANEMLSKLHVKRQVRSCSDIDASLFVTLYEGLCAEPLKDAIRDPRSVEDNIHNCQAVIDSLSLDVLNTPLSHITGQDVVAGDLSSIGDLLEVCFGLMEFILEEISSAASTDGHRTSDAGDEVESTDDRDPDMMTPEVLSSVLDQHMSSHRRERGATSSSHVRNGTQSVTDSRHIEKSLSDLSLRDSRPATTSNSITAGRGDYVVGATRHDPATSQGGAVYGVADQVNGAATYAPSGRGSSEQYYSSSFLARGLGISSGDGFAWSGKADAGSDTAAAFGGLSTHDRPSSRATGGLSASMPQTKSSLPYISDGYSRLPSAMQATDAQSISSDSFADQPGFAELDRNSEDRLRLFESVGSRSRPRTADQQGLAAAAATEETDGTGAVSRLLNDQHSFTHHLYHHYDTLPDSHQNGAGSGTDALSEPVRSMASAAVDAAPSVSTAYTTGAKYSELDRIVQEVLARSHSIETRSRTAPKPARSDQTTNRRMARDAVTDSRISSRETTSVHGTRSEPLLVSSTRTNANKTSPRQAKTSSVAQRRNVTFGESRSDADVSHTVQSSADGSFSDRQPDDTRLKTGKSSSPSGPRTYRDYLQKYYGDDSHHRLSATIDDLETSYLSDGCVNYQDDYSRATDRTSSRDRTTFESELAACKQRLQKKAKAVRFEDYLDDAAAGYVGGLRRQFKTEDQKSRYKTGFLAKCYEDELRDLANASQSELGMLNKSAKETESKYKKFVLKPPQTSRFKTNKFARPVSGSILRPRSRSLRRAPFRDRKRSASASPDVGRRKTKDNETDNDILPWLLEEFPYMHLAPATLQNLWRKGSLQLELLSRAEAEAKHNKSKAQEQINEAGRRQQLLVDILHKEQLHRQRLKDAKDRKQLQLTARSSVRDRRLQSARVRKYYEEYQVRQRSRMLKKRTKEELVFKRLFNDGLNIQRERIRELRKYAKDQRLERSKQQQLELEALENFYKDQFSLLAESMDREKTDVRTREKAQTKALLQMKRELRKKMEQEISEFQRRLWQDEDDVYFRELDADRMRRELHVAQYQARL